MSRGMIEVEWLDKGFEICFLWSIAEFRLVYISARWLHRESDPAV